MHFSTMVGSFFLRISCADIWGRILTAENADIETNYRVTSPGFLEDMVFRMSPSFSHSSSFEKIDFFDFFDFSWFFQFDFFNFFLSAGKSLSISQQYVQPSYPIVASRNSTVVRWSHMKSIETNWNQIKRW